MRLFTLISSLLMLLAASISVAFIAQKNTEDTPKITHTIFTSGPLRGPQQEQGASLNKDKVVDATNQQRLQHNLPVLKNNLLLAQAAADKVEDMFKNQYFEHVSPKGLGPSHWVEKNAYFYLIVGENLALGNFQNETALVQAWMDSPGHRANILSPNFQEIGVAVKVGLFEGKTTWLAVQMFGTPTSVCPDIPSTGINEFEKIQQNAEELHRQITAAQKQLESRNNELSTLNNQVENLIVQGNEKIRQGNEEIEKGNQAAENGNRQQAEAHWQVGQELQAEGQAILKQAEEVQQQAAMLTDELKGQRSSYNRLVTQYQNLDEELSSLSSTTNEGIKKYNECLQKYQ